VIAVESALMVIVQAARATRRPRPELDYGRLGSDRLVQNGVCSAARDRALRRAGTA
jgi:hypothetical protein